MMKSLNMGEAIRANNVALISTYHLSLLKMALALLLLYFNPNFSTP